ncbi:MAG: EAL domain-containing protein [Lactobacillus sp.]|jgi:EAL domain-containing protein (putative c-di-GMP-specific phosphodiesterase class I)|nr:EAL domain-containing protein [Lactobacillus sp.]MCI2031993.1 EAL domain-containing protein [Lactobacillus sp.]
MFRFFGQPKFDLVPDHQAPIGYELFLREWRGGQWVLPANFSALTVDSIEPLLVTTIAAMPANIELLSFNLEQDQFIDPAFMAMAMRVNAQTSLRLFLELTERLAPGVTEDQLVVAAQHYADHGVLVCVDDVGTGQNSPQMVHRMALSVAEYKFALQNFRPFATIAELAPKLNLWYRMAQATHKMLAIEGLETPEELAVIRRDYPCDVIQGYLLGKPALL